MNLFESNEKEEIRRNIAFLLSIYKYSCPMARDFGLEASFIDIPNHRAESIARNEIVETIKKYEPRAEIDEITFIFKNNRMYPIIKLKGID